jgi:type II restriction enzyme
MSYSAESQYLFSALRKAGILSSAGDIRMELLGKSIILNDKSIVGNALQGWLSSWMTDQGIKHSSPANAQEPPDFYLGASKSILEVKSFDTDASANFDIANFEAYKHLIVTKPEHLDADYLILGYSLRSGVLKIEKIWLKKIWEITSASGVFAIKTQNKRGQIYNIRPATWDSKRATYPVFGTKSSFLRALFDTTLVAKGRAEATRWYAELELALGVDPDQAK